jgi:hypothetical protein
MTKQNFGKTRQNFGKTRQNFGIYIKNEKSIFPCKLKIHFFAKKSGKLAIFSAYFPPFFTLVFPFFCLVFPFFF